MKRRAPVPTQFFMIPMRAAVTVSNWARSTGPVVLVSAVMLTWGAVWLASATSANVWVWKSWTRLFGSPRQSQYGGALGPSAQPQQGTGNGAYTITTFDAPEAGTS